MVNKDDWESIDYTSRINLVDSNEIIQTNFNTNAFKLCWETLHEYQKEGCRWMNQLYQTGT